MKKYIIIGVLVIIIVLGVSITIMIDDYKKENKLKYEQENKNKIIVDDIKINITNEELSSNIIILESGLFKKNELTVIMKNNNKVDVSNLTICISFYDKNGNIIDTDNDDIKGLEGDSVENGLEFSVKFILPKEYSKYKIYAKARGYKNNSEVSKRVSKENILIKEIKSAETNKNKLLGKELSFKLTNNNKSTIKEIGVFAAYYKNGKLEQCSYSPKILELRAGMEEVVKLECPYEMVFNEKSNEVKFNDIPFDTYKIFLNAYE